ncbi:MAG: circadian clock KaiB family protein [Anaerolineae bacterium]|nr:circadian clock KaiB family protein [Anaerolineae bacterium]
MINDLALRLFVTGQTSRAERAIQTATAICVRLDADASCLEIIDILEQPQAAEQEHILATPTLVRESPLPRRRVVGDLSRLDEVLAILGLDSPATPAHGSE